MPADDGVFFDDLVFAGSEDVVGTGGEAEFFDDDINVVVENPFADEHALICNSAARVDLNGSDLVLLAADRIQEITICL